MAFTLPSLTDFFAWALLLILGGLVAWKLGASLRARIQKKRKIRWLRLVGGIAVSILTIAVLIFDLPYLVNKFVDIKTPEAKFWIQTVAGNWSPDAFPASSAAAAKAPGDVAPPNPDLPPAESYSFGVSASIAFWLNNAIIFLLISLAWRLSERRRAMDVAAALVMRDSFANTAAKQLVKERFDPDQRESILQFFRDAVEKGQTDLERHLPNIDSHAEEILQTIRDPRQTTSVPGTRP